MPILFMPTMDRGGSSSTVTAVWRHESEAVILKPGPVKLIIKGERADYAFLYSQGNDAPKEITRVMARYLSSETVGGFTGVYVGLYATGNGKVCTADADYDWFEYDYDGPKGIE